MCDQQSKGLYSVAVFTTASTKEMPQIIAGNHILIGAKPFAEPIVFLLQIRCAELSTSLAKVPSQILSDFLMEALYHPEDRFAHKTKQKELTDLIKIS